MTTAAGRRWRVSIHELIRQPGSAHDFSIAPTAGDDLVLDLIGVPAGVTITATGTLTSVGDGVLVAGDAVYPLAGQCSRCLDAFTDEGRSNFQGLYVYPGQPEPDTDDEIGHVEGEEIDLEPLIRDSILLDLPLAPLCDENCLGLCAECGVPLDADPAHHHAEPVDERWKGLAAFGASTSIP